MNVVQNRAPERVHANVIVRSATGKSAIADQRRIEPANVKEYLPDQAALRKASSELEALGLRIDLVAPTHVSVSGEPALFERLFGAKLALREFPVFAGERSKARQTRFVSETPLTVPPHLAGLIESVDLEPVVEYYTSATPPALAYDHLEVPADVARGMDALKAHEHGITGTGIRLAMVDSGFMTPLHPYYAGRGYAINPPVADVSDPSPGSDDYGHGTGISACALAVAPGVDYTVYKLGSTPAASFSRAVMAGPHIITNSWGIPSGTNTALKMAINDAVANGIVVLFAAGNGGPAAWPGSEPAVCAVGGAFLGSDDSVQASSYASSGTNTSNPGRQVPDFCGLTGQAPRGVYIALPTQPNSTVDTDFAGGTFPNGDETPGNDGWVVASGTSSATPMVAAVCALMMQADSTLIGDPGSVKAKLKTSCIDVTSGSSASGEAAGAGIDNATGAGLVQAYRAVHATDIWMRDNPDSDVGLVPTTGRRPAWPPFAHWTSPDIKVVGAMLADPQADFDGAAETDPIFGQDNYVYVKVRNRGTQAAAAVQTRLYYADPSTSLSYPSDWKNGSSGIAAAGSLKVSGVTSNLQTLATVPANGATVTPLPFVWRPPNPSSATQSQTLPDGRVRGHFCLLSRLSSADDPIIFPGGGQSSVVNDNNISMKNEQVYSAAAGGMFHFAFWARDAQLEQALREFQLLADVAALPAGSEIAVEIPAQHVKQHFTVTHPADQNGQPGRNGNGNANGSGRDRDRDRDRDDDRYDADERRAAALVSATATATAERPRRTAGGHQPALTLAKLVFKQHQQALVHLTLRLPGHTAPGRYPLPIGQQGGNQVVGGVTLVAEVV